MAQKILGRVLHASARRCHPNIRSKCELKSITQPAIQWYETDQVFRMVDFKNLTDAATFVRDSKIFENEHLISYNKPAGIKAFRNLEKGRKTNEDEPTVEDIMHLIKEETGCDYLDICEAPHWTYSGAMVFGKSENACNKVKQIFENTRRRNRFLRADLALSIGVPSPGYGIISTMYEQREIDGRSMLIPAFNPSSKQLKYGMVKPCRTTYRVLDDVDGIALVELFPRDDVPEQGLFHLSMKMCKVLGDTTYSNRVVTVMGVKMLVEPSLVNHGEQNLPSKLRKKLLMASEGRQDGIPLFMHRHTIKLPRTRALGLPEGLKISAPLPLYFSTMMRLLGLDMYGFHNRKERESTHEFETEPE